MSDFYENLQNKIKGSTALLRMQFTEEEYLSREDMSLVLHGIKTDVTAILFHCC